MQFSTGTLSRCSGQNHYKIDITIGGVTKKLSFEKDDVAAEKPANLEEAKSAILSRLISAAKEAGASTWAQVQAAVNNKTFQV